MCGVCRENFQKAIEERKKENRSAEDNLRLEKLNRSVNFLLTLVAE